MGHHDLFFKKTFSIRDFEFAFVDLSAYSNEAIKAGVFKAVSLRIALLIM